MPDGTATTTFYTDIPVTSQTIAEVTVNGTTSIQQLTIDVNGDGVIDFIVQPQTEFNPILYLQIMKKTIDSFDLSQNKKEAFDKKVDKIIALLQKGKIDKAKNKIQNISQTLVNKLEKPLPKHPKPGKLSKTDAQLLLDMLNQLLDNLS